MSSTVGHALCGIACLLAARAASPPAASTFAGWYWLPAFALLANVPDLDFLAGFVLYRDFHRFHSGPSHSLLFAVCAAALVSLALGSRRCWLAFPWIAAALVSHVLIDLFTGPVLGWQVSYGVPLWWPFDGARVRMPLTTFFGVEHSTLNDLLSWHNVKAMVTEIATFAPLVVLLWVWVRRRAAKLLPTPANIRNIGDSA